MKEQETHTAYDLAVLFPDHRAGAVIVTDLYVRTKHSGHAVDNADGTAIITWPDGTVSNVLSFTKKR
jgi:hypothetical protein